MGWSPPDHWKEDQAQLKKSGVVTLNASGQGTIYFDPDTARQRWVVNTVIVTTNQAFSAGTVPTVNLALNSNDVTTMSDGNQRGATWSGNQDTWSGEIDVGPADFLSIIFSPPAGQSGTSLNGVICNAVVTGVKFNRRA
jgi:hypothetical protein